MKLSYSIYAYLLALLLPEQALADVYSDTTSLAGVEITYLKMGAAADTMPFASTRVDRVEAERLGIISIKGLSDVAPNFYIPDYGSRVTSSIYVRGLGARMDQPAVGLTVDNVPILNKDAFDLDVVDIASMEVLRGPQSTMFGRNTMCGLITISTISPMRFNGWRTKLEYSSANTWKASAGWYSKINSSSAFSLAAGGSTSDGFYRNLYNGDKTGAEKMINGRANYIFESDKIKLRNVVASSYLKQSGYPYQSVASGEINYNDTCFYRRFLISDGLTMSWNMARAEWTSITSLQHIADNLTLDQDFLPLSYFTLTQKKHETGLTHDIMAKGGSGNWQWLNGAFLFYKHNFMRAPVTFLDDGIRQLIEEHRNASNPEYPVEWYSRKFTLNSDFRMPTFGCAIYHRSQFTFGPYTIEAALRLDYEKATLHYKNYCNTGYTIYHEVSETQRDFWRNVDVDLDEKGTLHRSFLELLPRISISRTFEQLPMSSVYFSLAKGYKAGGFNTQMFSDVLQQRLMGIMGVGASYDINQMVGYKPEKSWNYEAGAHLTLSSIYTHIDATLFYIDCRDQQLTMFPDGTTTGRMMTNAGRTRSCGAEISAVWSKSRYITLQAAYGYTNAKFLKFFNGKTDYAGKHIPYAPSNTLFAQVSSSPLKNFNITIYTRCAGPIYWNEENSLKQPFYAVCGANLSYQLPCGLTMRLFADNITSTRHSTFYFVSMGNEFVQRGRPRTIGVSMQYNISLSR